MENNDNWAYVEMFGKVRYCRVTRTDAAKGLDKEHCFKGRDVCWIGRPEDWYGWHHYKNKVAVAVKRDDWINFYIG